jgi:hypothetical protein
MSLDFTIDIDAITQELKETSKELAKDLLDGVEGLATMTHLKTLELSRDKLGSLSKKYSDAITFENPMKGLWIINLDEKAMFIEENYPAHFMSELLEGKSARTAKDGTKFAVIPFEHSKAPSEMSHKAQDLSKLLKDEFKKRGISWKKIELNPDGSPRTGVVHRFDVESARPTANSGDPALKGVTVYQSKGADGNMRRDILTFRTISEKSEEQGKWQYPGREGSKLLDLSFEWAEKEWSEKILPEILSKYSK